MYLTDPQKKLEISDFTVGVLGADVVTSGIKKPLWLRLPDRLREVREEANLFQIEVADLAGLSRSIVCALESGEHRPNAETIERIACALGISPTWRAFGHDGFWRFYERIPRKGFGTPRDPVPDPARREFVGRYKSIATRMKWARERGELSMRGLARSTQLSPQAITLIEAGRSVPLIPTLENISKVLGVSPGWLAFEDGSVDD